MNLGKKIVIVGANGSGKTTFAKKLSDRLSIPHFELDFIFWKPDWKESENDEFREKVLKVTSKDAWIVDGNYARNQDLTLTKADTIIWLDVPFHKMMYRVTKRSIKRIISKEPLWHNNRESFGKLFSKDSIILFAAKTYKRKNKRYKNMISSNEISEQKWIVISSKAVERQFWNELNKNNN